VSSPRRSVARRVLVSFVILLMAFASTQAFAGFALRRASEDAEELGKGLVPIALKIAQLRSMQETLATLIDGIPDERNPVTAKHLLTTLVNERTLLVADLRVNLEALGRDRPSTSVLAHGMVDELDEIDAMLSDDAPDFDTLYRALAEGDRDTINRVLIHLGAIEHGAKTKLRALAGHMTSAIGQLSVDARERERRSFLALLSVALAALLLGVGLSLHARRILAPLGTLNARARAVAQGDLSPQPVDARDDEIGELQESFENMVEAVGKARERAVSNERFAAIGKMAAHVTHEVRNPLSSIGLNLELLEEELEGPEQSERRTLVQAIRREVDRLERLSEEYLRVARLPSPRMEADDVASTLRSVVEFEAKETERAQCTVTVEIGEPAPLALFDESQLRQALLNLLRNAREAMPQGGTIDVRAFAEGLSAVVTIGDRGAGIPDDVRPRIFDPFFSTKGEGTGLGLAITRQIVEAHGGTIACEAREGGGTLFRIALPLTPSHPTSHAPSPPTSTRSNGGA
jgi:two-component system, NtrC family, sensor kinase